MSAQANLAGLFVPSEEETFHKKLPWQPIPVHTIPIDFDSALFGAKHCPKYDHDFQNHVKDSEEVQRIYTDNADQFSYWSRMCGREIVTIKDCYNLHKTISIEKLKNKVSVYLSIFRKQILLTDDDILIVGYRVGQKK